MIKSLVLITICFWGFCFGTHAQQGNTPNDTLKLGNYQINKIIRKKNIYVIYASKDQEHYKIVSFKESKKNNCNKIKKGKIYYLKLSSYFGNYDFSRFTINYVVIKGVSISIDKKFQNNLYFTKDINGLYLNCK